MSSVHPAFGPSEVEGASSDYRFSRSSDLISSARAVCDLVMAAATNQMRVKGPVEISRESHDHIMAMLQTRIGNLEGQYIRNSHPHVRLLALIPKVARSARHSSLPLGLSFSYTSPISFLSI